MGLVFFRSPPLRVELGLRPDVSYFSSEGTVLPSQHRFRGFLYYDLCLLVLTQGVLKLGVAGYWSRLVSACTPAPFFATAPF